MFFKSVFLLLSSVVCWFSSCVSWGPASVPQSLCVPRGPDLFPLASKFALHISITGYFFRDSPCCRYVPCIFYFLDFSFPLLKPFFLSCSRLYQPASMSEFGVLILRNFVQKLILRGLAAFSPLTPLTSPPDTKVINVIWTWYDTFCKKRPLWYIYDTYLTKP